jgi:hypothetical protein
MKIKPTFDEHRTELALWYCNGCESVHLAVDSFRLSFNRSEFAALTQMVLETHYAGWPEENVRSLAADQVAIDARETTASIQYLHEL